LLFVVRNALIDLIKLYLKSNKKNENWFVFKNRAEEEEGLGQDGHAIFPCF